jgi:hypothetical protein
MSEAHTEDRLGRIEATLASLVPLIHRIDERLNTVLPHLATKAELTAGLSDLRTEITELKIELADKPSNWTDDCDRCVAGRLRGGSGGLGRPAGHHQAGAVKGGGMGGVTPRPNPRSFP